MKRELLLLFLLLTPAATAFAARDVNIQERIQYKKPIRVKMPPQIMIETLQKELAAKSDKWLTFWQNFVVEDDDKKDEFVIICRSAEKPWAFGLLKEDCPKPDDYDKLAFDVQKGVGTPTRIDLLIGVRRKRSWFRYVVTVYEPMYDFWKNPCYVWNLPPNAKESKFYRENYTMQVYADNLKQKVYDLVDEMSNWKPPKEVKKIPVMRGKGVELIGGESEDLTDEQRMLSVEEQQKILEGMKKGKKKKK